MNKQTALRSIRRHVDALERAELGTEAYEHALDSMERLIGELSNMHVQQAPNQEPGPGQRLGTILEDVHDMLSKRTFRAPVLRAGERVVIEEAHADWIRVRKLNSNHIVNLMARKVRETPQ